MLKKGTPILTRLFDALYKGTIVSNDYDNWYIVEIHIDNRTYRLYREVTDMDIYKKGYLKAYFNG